MPWPALLITNRSLATTLALVFLAFFSSFGLYFHFVASLLIISLEQLENFVGLIDSRVAAKVNGPFVPASHLFKRSFHFSYLLLLICVFVLLIYVFR